MSGSPVKPIHEETIPFKVTDFKQFPIKAAIDRGCTLTKVAFVPKSTPDDADIVQLRCLTFVNDHFEDALKVMKEEAKLPTSGGLHVTGVGAATYQQQIRDIIGLDTIFINELATIGYGPFLLINNCKKEDIFYPIPKFRTWKGHSEATKEILENIQKATAEKGDEPFPGLIVNVGSAYGVVEVNEKGESDYIAASGLSGRPMSGIAHALLGTADYDEIMRLAENGDQTKVDTTVGDLTKDDPESPYGDFSPSAPALPFGKAANKSWKKDDCKTEDLAASLVGLFAYGVAMDISTCVNSTGISKVYLTGNFFRHELMRKLVLQQANLLFEGINVEIQTLVTGHGGAVAAMLLESEAPK